VRGRALAAGLLLASPAAWAHGGSIPAWIPVILLSALAAFVACAFAPLFLLAGEPIWVRIVSGLGLAAADVFAWYVVALGVFHQWPGLEMPERQRTVAVTLLTLLPWILPVALVAWKTRRRR